MLYSINQFWIQFSSILTVSNHFNHANEACRILWEILLPSYMRSSQTLGRCLWLQTLPERSDENWPNRPITSPHEEHQSETSASPVDERLYCFFTVSNTETCLMNASVLFSKVKITLSCSINEIRKWLWENPALYLSWLKTLFLQKLL